MVGRQLAKARFDPPYFLNTLTTGCAGCSGISLNCAALLRRIIAESSHLCRCDLELSGLRLNFQECFSLSGMTPPRSYPQSGKFDDHQG